MNKVHQYIGTHKRSLTAISIIAVVIVGGLCLVGTSGTPIQQPKESIEQKASKKPSKKDADLGAKQDSEQAENDSSDAADDPEQVDADTTPEKAPAAPPANSNAQPAAKPSGSTTGNISGSQQAAQPQQPAAPAHSHTWYDVTIYEDVWVSNWVEETTYVTRDVKIGTWFWCGCGWQSLSSQEWEAHETNHLNNEEFWNYGTKPAYEKQQVPVTEQIDKGHYETRVRTYQACECGATR